MAVVSVVLVLYDNDQRLTTITTSYGGSVGPEVVYSYSPANQIVSETRFVGASINTSSQLNTTFSYDAANRETTITDWTHNPNPSGGGNAQLATYVYSYDDANRVTSETDAEGTYTYTYDSADELTGVNENGTPVGTYRVRRGRQHDFCGQRYVDYDLHLRLPQSPDGSLSQSLDRYSSLKGRTHVCSRMPSTRGAVFVLGRSGVCMGIPEYHINVARESLFLDALTGRGFQLVPWQPSDDAARKVGHDQARLLARSPHAASEPDSNHPESHITYCTKNSASLVVLFSYQGGSCVLSILGDEGKRENVIELEKEFLRVLHEFENTGER
jgi:YD repeat-containing protein